MDTTGKKPKRHRHSFEKKVEVVKQKLDGNSVNFTAAKNGVHRNQVNRWSKDPEVQEAAKNELSVNLHGVVRLTSEQLVEALSDPEVAKTITPQQKATIMGIAADKLVAINGWNKIQVEGKVTTEFDMYIIEATRVEAQKRLAAMDNSSNRIKNVIEPGQYDHASGNKL
jgi:transposase-like protein